MVAIDIKSATKLKAWVNAMPGPGMKPRLHVIGTVPAPNPGSCTYDVDGGCQNGAARVLETRIPLRVRILKYLLLGAGDPEWDGRKTTDLWGAARVFRTSPDDVVRAVGGLSTGFHEFYFHPGANKPKASVPDDGLGDWGQDRSPDLACLRNPRVIAAAKLGGD